MAAAEGHDVLPGSGRGRIDEEVDRAVATAPVAVGEVRAGAKVLHGDVLADHHGVGRAVGDRGRANLILVVIAKEDAVAFDNTVVAVGLGALMDAGGVAETIVA